MRAAVVIAMVIATVMADPIKYYEGLLENTDIEKTMTNPETLKGYTDCFLDRGPCSVYGERIKKVIPESVVTACLKCTPKQKRATRRYFEELVKLDPKDVEAFNKKYDPEFKYFFKFLEAVKDA